MWLLASWACVGGEEEPCGDGFGRAGDGNCYPLAGDDDDSGTHDSGHTWTTTGTTSDTGPTLYEGPILVESASVECSGDMLIVGIETVGAPSNAVVHLRDNANANAWSENHPLHPYMFDPWRAWGQLEVALSTGATVADWMEGGSTVFTCTHVDDGVMSYAAGVWDSDANFADCLAWGYDPQEIIDNPSADLGEPAIFPVADCVIGTATF